MSDASTGEIDRMNARAQHLRAERGELGEQEVDLPDVSYGLREGDRVAFVSQYRPRGSAGWRTAPAGRSLARGRRGAAGEDPDRRCRAQVTVSGG